MIKRNRIWMAGMAGLLTGGVAMAEPDAPPPGGPQDGPPPMPHRHHERDHRGGPDGHRALRMEKVTFLGVAAEPADEALRAQLGLSPDVGLVVIEVIDKSPAAAAGVQKFDVLQKLDDQVLVNHDQLRTLIRNHKAGDTVQLTLIRNAKPLQVGVKLAEQEVPVAGGPLLLPQFDPHRFDQIHDTLQKMREQMKDGDPQMKEAMEQLDRQVREMQEQMPRPEHFRFPGGPGGPGGPGWRGGMWGPGGWGPGGPMHRRDLRNTGEPGRSDTRTGSQNTTTHSTASAAYSDDQHTLNLTVNDGKETLVAKDASGKEVFSGPIDTPEERQKIPAEIRPKLEQMERQTGIGPHPAPPPPAGAPHHGGPSA